MVFLNADRTIYGRYGTRAGGRNDANTHISVPGFKKAMERALATHKGYPANKEQLARYTSPRAEFATPEKIPTMRTNNCIHCHQVHDSLLRHKWEQKELKATDLFVYPLPERIGLKMDPEDCLVVGDPKATPVALSLGRIDAQKDHWKIDAAVSLGRGWHGASVIARADGFLIGVLLVEGRKLLIVPPPAM